MFVSFSYEAAYYDGSVDGDLPINDEGYHIENNPVYNRLRQDKSLDIDGRNFIYVLRSAHYWDRELCERALGYGPEEVTRRLEGKVPKIARLMDGVYIVFNDDPKLDYQTFVEMNTYYKSILGLE